MTNERYDIDQDEPIDLGPRTLAAIDELRRRILAQFPSTSFRISRAPDDPTIVHLTAVVDVDDPDVVTASIIDRLVELQVEEQIPVYVIPIRTPERVLADMRAGDGERRHRPTPAAPLVPGG